MSNRQILTFSFLIFMSMGMLSATLGPALDDLARQTGTNLDVLGAIFTASFLGTMLAQAAVGPINDRIGQRKVLLAGIVLIVTGMSGILLSHTFGLTLAFSSVFGMGFGALDVSTNVLIAEVFAARSVPVLNLLHVFFGVGSVIGPAIASGTLRLWDSALPALVVGMVVAVIPVAWVVRLATGPVHAQDDPDEPPPGQFSYRVPLLWALGVILMLYVGVEAGLGAWITTYADRSTSLTKESGALLASGFWFALTVGRVAGALWGGRLAPYTVLGVSLWGMLGGGILFVAGSGSIALTVLAVLVTGLFAGPPFPTVVAITTRTFRSGPGKATGAVVSTASLGSAALPWLQGVVLDRAGTGAYAVLVVGMIALMVAVFVVIRQRQGRVAAEIASPAIQAEEV
jgi:FHS family Na+ dependent glucose MFS transporter 1